MGGGGGGGAVLFCCDVYTRLLIMFSDWEHLILDSAKPFTYQRRIISKVIFIRILLSVIVLFSTVGTGQWFLPAVEDGTKGSLSRYLSIYLYIPNRFSSMCSNFEMGRRGLSLAIYLSIYIFRIDFLLCAPILRSIT